MNMRDMRFRMLSTLLFLSILLMPISFILTAPGSGMDDLSTDIVVNGNGGFSEVVRSGKGTIMDPYIISDYNVSSANIQIKNTTAHLIIRNITFNSGSWTDRWGFYLYNADNVIIENVTSDGKLHFLYSIYSQYLTIRNCNVNSVPSGNYLMEFRVTSFLTITESSFSRAPSTGGSTVFFDNQGGNQELTENVFTGISLTDQSFHSTGIIHNCTFSDSSVYLQSGNAGGRITDNVFRSPGKTALQLQATYRLTITGNYFEADRGIYFTGCPFQWLTNPGYLENNTFENCTVGIDAQLQTQNQPSRWIVKNNYFGNCTSYAINWQRGRGNWIFHNIFYHNAGTDDVNPGYQVYQANMFNNLNIWTDTSGGNFWANHRKPDKDVNGVVDVEYTINVGGKDTLPFTNPYFDTERPVVVITNPRGEYSESSYIRIAWDAQDDSSGVGEQYLSVDGGPIMDITNRTVRSIFLEGGTYSLNLTVYDRAGLYSSAIKMVTLNGTMDVLSIESPIQGEYYDDDPVRIKWSVRTGFPVMNQSITIDGSTKYLVTGQRVFESSLSEGYHEVSIRIIDDQELAIDREAGFYVDMTPPTIEVLSPQRGSVLSNPIVSINFEASDNLELSGMMIKIDDGDWEDAMTFNSLSRFMKTGPHLFEAEAVDMAGLTTNVSVPFMIGGMNGLKIISPYDGLYTYRSSIPFIWEYNGTFDWVYEEIRIGSTADFQAVNQLPDGLVYLPDNDEYEITLRLVDEYENYIETTITVVKDDISPTILLSNPDSTDPSSDRDLVIEWIGLDGSGIASYSIMIDDGDWIDVGLSTEYPVSLDEGSHTITILAMDLAGNTGENRFVISMDYTVPLVGLLTPRNGSILKDPSVTFLWQAEDDDMIESLILIVDEDPEVDLMDRSDYFRLFSQNKYHTAVLRAVDRAGNIAEYVSIFLIDTSPPVVVWGDGPGKVYGHEWANITFEILEEAGLRELYLYIGGINRSVSVDVNFVNITLEDGSYDLSIFCVDLAGHVEEDHADSPMIIDTIPPNVTISHEQTTVLNGKGVVYWISDGTGSDIVITEVSVDGGPPVIMVAGNTFSTEVLSPGGHAILIRSYDSGGNSGEALWTFEIEGSEIIDDGRGERGSTWLLIAAIVVVLFILGLIILGSLVVRKRRMEEAGRDKFVPDNQMAPQLSLAKMAQNLPTSAMMEPSQLPPTVEPEVEDRVDGTGYIRPMKEPEKGGQDVSRHRLRSDGRSIGHGMDDDRTEELGDSRDRETGTPWSEERKKVLVKEAAEVFVGQQTIDDIEPEGTGPPIWESEEAEEDLDVWGDDLEEAHSGPDGRGPEPPGQIGSDPMIPSWDDVEFDDDLEELEELEEMEELE